MNGGTGNICYKIIYKFTNSEQVLLSPAVVGNDGT